MKMNKTYGKGFYVTTQLLLAKLIARQKKTLFNSKFWNVGILSTSSVHFEILSFTNKQIRGDPCLGLISFEFPFCIGFSLVETRNCSQ